MKIKQTELLAPAKDLETGITAINSGADAVYIGASAFGARHLAGNRLEDIKDFRFSDFCEGYFDEDAEYHLYTSDVEDSSVLI